MAKNNDTPKMEEQTQEELDHIKAMVKAYDALSDKHKKFILAAIDCALWFPHILQDMSITLRRLRIMIFGKGYANDKPTKKSKIPLVKPDVPPNVAALAALNTAAEIEEEINKNISAPLVGELLPPEPTIPKPGHGRMPHSVYTNATIVNLIIDGFKVGMQCPKEFCTGKMYPFEPRKPKTLLRVKGQNMAAVLKYIVERARCNLCGYIVSAIIPDDVGSQKYDAKFKALIVVNKYFMAMPFFRQEKMFAMLGCPVSDSTQWDLVEQAASSCLPIYNYL